jgi:hypothetical protein
VVFPRAAPGLSPASDENAAEEPQHPKVELAATPTHNARQEPGSFAAPKSPSESLAQPRSRRLSGGPTRPGGSSALRKPDPPVPAQAHCQMVVTDSYSFLDESWDSAHRESRRVMPPRNTMIKSAVNMPELFRADPVGRVGEVPRGGALHEYDLKAARCCREDAAAEQAATAFNDGSVLPASGRTDQGKRATAADSRLNAQGPTPHPPSRRRQLYPARPVATIAGDRAAGARPTARINSHGRSRRLWI